MATVTAEQVAEWRSNAVEMESAYTEYNVEYVVPALCDALTQAWAERDAALAALAYIDAHAPLADATCDEPGITLSEAARRAVAELQAERDALAAELASYRRGAAAIAAAVDENGRYVP